MDNIKLTRVPDGEPNQFTMTMPEGTIFVRGTPGFTTGAFKALLAPGSLVRAIMIEHTNPEDMYEAWRQAAADAGLTLPPLDEL